MYRQNRLLAVSNVCFGISVLTQRNATHQINALSATHTIQSHLHQFRTSSIWWMLFWHLVRLNCATIGVVVDDIDYLLSMPSLSLSLSLSLSCTTIAHCYANSKSSCHFRIYFILSVRLPSEKCERPLNDVLNGTKMGVNTLFQFIAIRQVNLVETHKQNRFCLNDGENIHFRLSFILPFLSFSLSYFLSLHLINVYAFLSNSSVLVIFSFRIRYNFDIRLKPTDLAVLSILFKNAK